MDVLREEVAQAFEGPLAEVDGLPTGILYAVVLTVAHAAGKHVRQAVTDALRPLLGEPSVSKDGLLGGLVRYAGNLPLAVTLRRKTLTLAVGRRLKASKVQDLVHALAAVPGAQGLRLKAERRVFSEPGAKDHGPIE